MNLRILRNPKVNLTAATIVAVTAFAAGTIYINQTPPTQRLNLSSDTGTPSSQGGSAPSTTGDPQPSGTSASTSEPQTGSTSSPTTPSAATTGSAAETPSGGTQTADTQASDTTDQAPTVTTVSATLSDWQSAGTETNMCPGGTYGVPYPIHVNGVTTTYFITCEPGDMTTQRQSCVYSYSNGEIKSVIYATRESWSSGFITDESVVGSSCDITNAPAP